MVTNKITTALRGWREAKGLTQYEMAERTGIHRAQIASWESGRHSPTFDSLEEVARFFHVDIVRLIAGPSALIGNKHKISSGPFIYVPLYIPPVYPSKDPDGSYPVLATMDGMIAVEFSDNSSILTEMAGPEVRAGDVWVGRFGGKPDCGQLAIASKNDDSEVEIIGSLDHTKKFLVPPNPLFRSHPLDGLTIKFIFHHLLWRDVSSGLKR